MNGLTAAQPVWNEHGEAYNAQFDDHYFSTDNGAAESQYIFVEGNNIPQRFTNEAGDPVSVICDVGFGTGLNAAVVFKLRHQLMQRGVRLPPLTYLAIDKHPLRSSDFNISHQRFETYQDEFHQLENLYPHLVQGFHIREIPDYNCRIIFIWNDIYSALTQWDGLVDAWFLDGFKPSTNQDMWTNDLYQEMRRLSHCGTTVATYTAAGHVRRGLISAGFSMKKRPGFGHKRHALHGVYDGNTNPTNNSFHHNQPPPPWSPMCRPKPSHQPRVAIIGAGIAGATIYHALAQYGITSSVFERSDHVADGGSGNRLGLGHPLLHGGVSRQGDWYDAAFLHSLQWPLNLEGQGAILAANDEDTHKRWAQLDGSIPEEIASFIPPDERRLPHGGCLMSSALRIRPAETVADLLDDLHVKTSCEIVDYRRDADEIFLIDQHGDQHGPFSDIVVTTAQNTLCPEILLTMARGQVIDVDSEFAGPAWSGRHYILPGQPPLAGASYKLNDHDLELRASEAEEVIQALDKHGIALGPWTGSGRASLRALSPDRLPYVGPLPDIPTATESLRPWAGGAPPPRTPIPHQPGLWCSIGHGSRGLTGACYAATMLADAIVGRPPSTPLAHRQWVMPLRLLMRELRKKGA